MLAHACVLAYVSVCVLRACAAEMCVCMRTCVCAWAACYYWLLFATNVDITRLSLAAMYFADIICSPSSPRPQVAGAATQLSTMSQQLAEVTGRRDAAQVRGPLGTLQHALIAIRCHG